MKTNRKPRTGRSFTPLQDEILRVATEIIGPAVAVRIVSRKFAEAGVRLTADERRELHQLILDGRLNRFAPKRRRASAAVVTFTAADGEALAVEATNQALTVFNKELKRTDPRWTAQNPPLIDSSKPAISDGRPRLVEFYFVASS